MKQLNMKDVQEAGHGGDRLPAGGYVCRYVTVNDNPDKEYLYMEFEIAEGKYKDYFGQLEAHAGFYAGRCYRSYKEKALPMFKRMCSAVTKSNPGYIFDGGQQNSDEKTLVGKLVGIVLAEEDYEKQDGTIGQRLNVAYECAVDVIRAGNFKVPEKKVILAKAEPVQTAIPGIFTPIDADTDEEIPFN